MDLRKTLPYTSIMTFYLLRGVTMAEKMSDGVSTIGVNGLGTYDRGIRNGGDEL